MISGLILYWAWSWLMMLAGMTIMQNRLKVSDILFALFLGWLLWIVPIYIYCCEDFLDKTIWRKK